MKSRVRLRFMGLVITCFWFFLLFSTGTTQAVSSNSKHELGVYSLELYGTYGSRRWKNDVVAPSYERDPYRKFWEDMTHGSSSEFAHYSSTRYHNNEVNCETVLRIPGGPKDWDEFDMVFFYGHNNMITPPFPCEMYHHFWTNNTGSWTQTSGNWCDWGSVSLPYEYYRRDVTGGRANPGAVVYLYEPFTSALLGGYYHFDPDAFDCRYQKSAQDEIWGNTAATSGPCSVSGLGTNDLEWLILYGCKAVIVANEDGSAYHPIGVKAFQGTWDGFHIILGHYRSYFTGQLQDLTPFANGLKSGMFIQAAYFSTDPAQNSSAISAEWIAPWDLPWSLFELWSNGYMNTETWLNPKPDISGSPNIWFTKWIRHVGTGAEDWEW